MIVLPPLSKSTRDSYRQSQERFLQWCVEAEIRQPATYEEIGAYLESLRTGGAGRVVLQLVLSALARMYREQGRDFDTMHPAVREPLRALGMGSGRSLTGLRGRPRHRAEPEPSGDKGWPDPVEWWR